MKTSAELLRVLREFVKKAQKSRQAALPKDGGPSRRGSPAGNGCADPGSPGSGRVQRSRSEGALLRGGATPSGTVPFGAGGGRRGEARALLNNAMLAGPLTEAAVLYYHDGFSRVMTSVEAEKQMEGKSKLSKEFWQDIRVLQAPVQASHAGAALRRITYSHSARTGGAEPQAPVPPLAQRRSGSSAAQVELGWDAQGARVAAVPRRINSCLAAAPRGKCGAGRSVISGQFEFAHDEADNTLWLLHTCHLLCERRTLPDEEEAPGRRRTVTRSDTSRRRSLRVSSARR